jgi:hypothetical protein
MRLIFLQIFEVIDQLYFDNSIPILLSKSTREEREMPLGLILREGKIPNYTSYQERVGNIIDG